MVSFIFKLFFFFKAERSYLWKNQWASIIACQVSVTGLNVVRNLQRLPNHLHFLADSVLCRDPGSEFRAGGGNMYLVRPREGRISTMKIKNM